MLCCPSPYFWIWASHSTWSSPFKLVCLSPGICLSPLPPPQCRVYRAFLHGQLLGGSWGSELRSPRLRSKPFSPVATSSAPWQGIFSNVNFSLLKFYNFVGVWICIFKWHVQDGTSSEWPSWFQRIPPLPWTPSRNQLPCVHVSVITYLCPSLPESAASSFYTEGEVLTLLPLVWGDPSLRLEPAHPEQCLTSNRCRRNLIACSSSHAHFSSGHWVLSLHFFIYLSNVHQHR